MYPSKLDFEKGTVYYRESDCFTQSPYHLVHAYPHLNYSMKMHAHQFCEINIITGGEGRHYIGDTSLPARVGDVFIIPPETPHGYYSEGQLDISHILLRDAFLSRYREELSQLPAFLISSHRYVARRGETITCASPRTSASRYRNRLRASSAPRKHGNTPTPIS